MERVTATGAPFAPEYAGPPNGSEFPLQDALAEQARFAARLCRAPIALVTLGSAERWWFAAGAGLDVAPTTLDPALFRKPILARDLVVVPDPLPSMRFYAGLPIFDPTGEPVGSLCVMDYARRDLSYEEAEDLRAVGRQIGRLLALRAQLADCERERCWAEEQLRDLAEAVGATIWEVDLARGRFRAESGRSRKVLGTSVDQWPADPSAWREYIHPEDFERLAAIWQAAVTEGRPAEAECRVFAPGGRLRWFWGRVEALRDTEGHPERLRGLLLDVTGRKRDEAELQQAAVALEAVGEAIMFIDRGGTIHYVNPAFERITGYSRATAVGRALDLLRCDERDRARYLEMWETLQRGESWKATSLRRKFDGTLFHAEETATPVRDERGRLQSAVVVKRDVTERVRRERELEAVVSISAALRGLHGREEIVATILDQTIERLQADGAALALEDPATGELAIVRAAGRWASWTGKRLPRDRSVTPTMMTTGRPDFALDARADSHLLFHGLPNGAVVPLIADGRPFGALWLGRRHHLDEAGTRVLSAIADIAANAIHRATLHEQTRHRAEQLALVSEVGQSLAESLELPELHQRLRRATARLFPDSTCGIVWLFDQEKGLIVPAYVGVPGHPGNLSGGPVTLDEESPQGRVLASRRPLILNDLQDPPSPSIELGRRRARSALFVPMLGRGRTVGLIELQSARPRRFTAEDAEVLGVIANTAAVAIENAHLFAATRRSLEYLQALRAVDEAIKSSLDLRVTLIVLLDQITTHLRVDAAAVLLLEPHTQALSYAAARGFRSRLIQQTSLRLGRGIAGRAALEQRTIAIPDLAASDEFTRPDLCAAEGFVAYYAVPLLAKGQVKGVLEIFHRSPLDPDAEWRHFLDALAGQASIALDNAELFDQLQRTNHELLLAYDTTLHGWTRTLELRDHETEEHAQRVAEMTVRLARTLGMPADEMAHIRRGALLHDIGKMGVPDQILRKPGPLTNDEWEIMRKHPIYARDLLAPIAFLRPALDIPACHHERWDGSGYPQGLKGEQIPLAARIFAVVDVWDALTSDRPYRPAWPPERALAYLREQAGRQFDPRVVEAFLRLVADDPGTGPDGFGGIRRN